MAAHPQAHSKFQVVVSDAQREASTEGVGDIVGATFWMYRIVMATSIPSYQKPPLFPLLNTNAETNFKTQDGKTTFEVWRRYSDFEWLLSELSYTFPGILMPPIPDKDASGTVDKLDTNLDQNVKTHPLTLKRIRQLQLFFNYLISMDDILETEIIKAFFTCHEEEFKHFKKVRKDAKPSGVDRAKEKGMSLFNRITNKKEVVFAPDHEFTVLKDAHRILGDNLIHCSKAAATIRSKVLAGPSWGNIGGAEPTTEPVCPLALYNDALVRDANNPSRTGSVRHVEGQLAWVDFNGTVERCKMDDLLVPPSGLSDPMMYASAELATQVDSFLSYASMNNTSKLTDTVQDLCWFWARFSQSLEGVVEKLDHMSQDERYVRIDASKAKDQAKKEALTAKYEAMDAAFKEGCQRFQTEYRTRFFPQFQAETKNIMMNFGEASCQYCVDGEWGSRLTAADTVLRLEFETPEGVQRDIEAIRSGSPMKASPPRQQSPPRQVEPEYTRPAVPAPVVHEAPKAAPVRELPPPEKILDAPPADPFEDTTREPGQEPVPEPAPVTGVSDSFADAPDKKFTEASLENTTDLSPPSPTAPSADPDL